VMASAHFMPAAFLAPGVQAGRHAKSCASVTCCLGSCQQTAMRASQCDTSSRIRIHDIRPYFPMRKLQS
jgi:hypothetical protein